MTNLFQNLPSAWWDKWAKVYTKRQHICWAQSKLLRKYIFELSSSNVSACWVHFRSLHSSGRKQILKQIRILHSLSQKIWSKIQNELLLTTCLLWINSKLFKSIHILCKQKDWVGGFRKWPICFRISLLPDEISEGICTQNANTFAELNPIQENIACNWAHWMCWVHFCSLLLSDRRQILKQIRILYSLFQKSIKFCIPHSFVCFSWSAISGPRALLIQRDWSSIKSGW